MNRKAAVERIKLLEKEFPKLLKRNNIKDKDWKPYVEVIKRGNKDFIKLVEMNNEVEVLKNFFRLTDIELK